MSCYSLHPENPGIACWHSVGHTGNHGKESYSWPNADDPTQIELSKLRANKELTESMIDMSRDMSTRDGQMVEAYIRMYLEITGCSAEEVCLTIERFFEGSSISTRWFIQRKDDPTSPKLCVGTDKVG